MNNFRLEARGRPGFGGWKLGDSILVCSVLAYIGSDITLYVDDPNAYGVKLIRDLSDQIYPNKYNVKFLRGTHSNILYPDQYYLENNIPTVQYTLTKSTGDYVTTQIHSRNNTRSIGDVSKYVGNRQMLDLSNAHQQNMTLKQLFDVVGNAQEHIGAASGTSWVAMSTGTPCTILLNSQHRRRHNFWDYALEAMYRNCNVRIFDV
jgi:hypothetical protein